jgi:hypothetical protein
MGGFALALVLHEVEDGVAFIDRALVLNPNLAAGWHLSAWVNLYLGKPRSRSNARRVPSASAHSIGWHFLRIPKWLLVISGPAAMTRPLRGRRRGSASRPIGLAQRALLQQAMRWPGGSIKPRRPWRGCARLIARCGCPISGTCSRFADRKTQRDTKRACEKRDCRSESVGPHRSNAVV